jgi:hypothetical protein
MIPNKNKKLIDSIRPGQKLRLTSDSINHGKIWSKFIDSFYFFILF